MYSEARRGHPDLASAGGWVGALVRGLSSLLDARPKTPRRALLLEERLALGGNRAVMLVACHGRHYLLGGSGDSLFLIGEVSPATESIDLSALAAEGSAGGNAMTLIAASTPRLLPLPVPADTHSVPWTVLFVLTLLTLLPAIVLSMTPMVRLLVVFHFLRQALGTQTAPSNQVLMGLALLMSWFLMQPVLMKVDQQAVEPFRTGQIDGWEAIKRGIDPPRIYMLHYAKEQDLAIFTSASGLPRPAKPEDLPLRVVAPAYMLSELKAGFEIGAILFLPFLLIDMIVASITTSIGMFQLPPVVISTPLKILLFVMANGWNLLAGSLLKSF
ncbi:flagellar type III secretion system pore protein FliP [Silvibacterium sp.]|uniref:flagellar type III secretion system pore protein FliP n=1 Tax=Silvibacterium sp. TaxID=1964179 RepID=UPI0039E679D6